MSLQRPLPQGSKFGLPRFVPHPPFLPARLCVCASFAEQSETDVLLAHLARQANERHSADDTERGCDSAGENPLAVQCPARPSPPPPLPPALPPPLSELWLTLPPPTQPPTHPPLLFQMGCKLDLRSIVRQARNAEYNPRRFAAVIMRIREPKTTALMFASGKMVCTGAKSEAMSQLAAKKYVRVVQKCGMPAEFQDFKVQNMVGSCAVSDQAEVLHTPTPFLQPRARDLPGSHHKMKQPKVVLLVFVSGKIVLTGKVQGGHLPGVREHLPRAARVQEERDPHSDSIGSSGGEPTTGGGAGTTAPCSQQSKLGTQARKDMYTETHSLGLSSMFIDKRFFCPLHAFRFQFSRSIACPLALTPCQSMA